MVAVVVATRANIAALIRDAVGTGKRGLILLVVVIIFRITGEYKIVSEFLNVVIVLKLNSSIEH